MKRLPQIGKELNIGVSTLLKYCHRIGHTRVSQNSKIDQQLESQIIDLYNGKISMPKLEQITEIQVSSLIYPF